MTHSLQHITDLAEILYLQGVRDVVISPGSRNAPLIRAFYKRFGENCTSIIDERSAAYFALGQSLVSQKPTVLISTSGTAALNYAPAVAEAFFQGVPLLIITADRPPEWIGQQNNQAIWQNNIFGKNVKAEYTLPIESTDKDSHWYAHRIINEAFYITVSDKPGSVHINVPLREPLYEKLPELTSEINIVRKEEPEFILKENSQLVSKWKAAKSIMIISGQLSPNNDLLQIVENISNDNRVVVVAEPTSNLHVAASVCSPEIVLNSKTEYPQVAIPELVMYFGGQVISQKIKLFLNKIKGATFFAILPDEQLIDTFQNVNSIIKADPLSVLKSLPVKPADAKSAFKIFWNREIKNVEIVKEKYTNRIGFSDLQTYKIISESLPEDAVVFAGNSNAVRYLSYFNQKNRVFYSNRGTSGIDGCLSTAAGLASKLSVPVYTIVGDLSFGYDSNALWNREIPKNLKIILVNNNGGGIFHLLKGPSETDAFIPLINAHHPIDFKKLTEAFGLNYHLCATKTSLQNNLNNLFIEKDKAEVLEIQTPNNGEPQITKDFFKFLNTNYGTQLDNA
ncbi:MAG: 2-succinyl-5-enolpyruvyl-6-hydroxy-3-cyclohexene-1-carboxylic-acid synthase [Bacteroidetes bacterium]|nr:2-succinyl-5-enolpyruvyl-6-hydroxy-3-cyclohexene-1-carboxylic-acid synthase [Bacteroidota bacterium]